MKIIITGNDEITYSIASECLCAGHDVVWREGFRKSLVTVADRLAAVLNLAGVAAVNEWREDNKMGGGDWAEADIIIDTIEESDEKKKLRYEEWERRCREETVIASCFGRRSVESLAELLHYPERHLGLYFFCPAWGTKAVEVVNGGRTGGDAVEIAEKLIRSIGKIPVHAPDYPGFILNRVLIPQWNEAVQMVMEGNHPWDIDLAMREVTRSSMGPLQFADFTGLDRVLNRLNYLYDSYHDVRFRASPLLMKMVESNNLGVKTGCGFYQYLN